jgi:hypothetical protein
MKVHAFFCALILLSIPILTMHATTPEGSNLSLLLEQKLIQSGFAPVRGQLASTGQDLFPFNIILDFPPVRTINSENVRSTIIIDFTQEDAFFYSQRLIQFIHKIQNMQLQCHVIVLFATLDTAIGDFSPFVTGTEVFARSFDNPDHSAAITVRFDESETNRILSGSAGDTSPAWLIKRLLDAFTKTKTTITLPHLFLSLYRLGILPDDPRMASFMKVSIPAAALILTNTTNLDGLEYFVESYSVNGTENWDRHYVLLSIPNHPIWIGEQIFVIFFLALLAISLLILCGFSFAGKNHDKHKADFIRSWFMIPLTIAVSVMTLEAAQWLCPLIPVIKTAAPLVQFSSKIAFSALFISLFFIIQEQLRLPVAPFIYGYLISLMAIANIIIFCTVDLSLFILFATEYILIYLSRTANRIIPLFFSLFLLLIPFMPYTISIFNNADPLKISRIIFCSPFGNFLLSCCLFPFYIMWLRMLVRLNLFGKAHRLSLRTVIIRTLLSIGLLIVVLGTGISIFPRFVSNTKITIKNIKKVQFITSTEKNEPSIRISDSHYMGMITRHIYIISKQQAVRYTIHIQGINNIPVYDSLYDYRITENTHTAEFILPDFPPKNMILDYATNREDPVTITITAYYKTEDSSIFTRSIVTQKIDSDSH